MWFFVNLHPVFKRMPMRKISLLVAVMLIVSSIRAQDTLKMYWTNQQLKSIGLAIDSVEEGFWQYFYRDGSRMMEGSFKNGQKVGKWKAWYDNGKPSQEYFADNGPFKSWYSNGNVESEGQFEDGLKSGHWKFYYPDGKLYRDCNYLNDSMNGLVTEYFDGDQKQFEGNYEHGRLNRQYLVDLIGEFVVFKTGTVNRRCLFLFEDLVCVAVNADDKHGRRGRSFDVLLNERSQIICCLFVRKIFNNAHAVKHRIGVKSVLELINLNVGEKL